MNVKSPGSAGRKAARRTGPTAANKGPAAKAFRGAAAGAGAGTAGAGRSGLLRGAAQRRPELVPHVPDVPDAPASGVRLGWREAISGTVTGLGFDLIEVERAQRGLLRIFIDRLAGREYPIAGEYVTVDDCEQVTRQLQYALEVEGLEYARLEVSSPGLDRPLRSEQDFERFTGQPVEVVLKVPFQGRKSWKGVLGRAVAAPADGVAQPLAAKTGTEPAPASAWCLVFEEGKAERVFGFGFDEVREARLVPVVDFKGRKSKDGGLAGAAAGAAPGTDQEA